MTTPLSVPPVDNSYISPHQATSISNNVSQQPVVDPPTASPRTNQSFLPFSESQPVAGPSRLPQVAARSATPPIFHQLNGNTYTSGPGSHEPYADEKQAVQARTSTAPAMQQYGEDQNGRGSGPTPEWAVMAQNMGMGDIPGANKDPILKQLQALQNSHAMRARVQNGGVTPSTPTTAVAYSPGSAASTVQQPGISSGTFSGPSSSSAMSPRTGPRPRSAESAAGSSSRLQQEPQNAASDHVDGIEGHQSHNGSGSRPTSSNSATHEPQTPRTPSVVPQPQTATIQSYPSRPTPSNTQNPSNPATPVNGQPRPPGGRVPVAAGDQRRQFLQTLVSYLNSANVPLPPEVFNGERDGSIKVAGVWVELVELFMLVMRVGGIAVIIKQPAHKNVLPNFLFARQVPATLPEPMILPRAANAPPAPPGEETTTDTAKYLIAVYLAWLQSFERNMTNQRALMAAKRQQLAGGTTPSRPPPGKGTPQPVPAPSPTMAPTPESYSAPTPSPFTPATAPTPSTYNTAYNTPTNQINYTSIPPTPTVVGDVEHVSVVPASTPAPGPIQIDPTDYQSASTIEAPPIPPTSASTSNIELHLPDKKRKRETVPPPAETILPSTPSANPSFTQHQLMPEPERPKTPKRARYKVEYKPLHQSINHLSGWDERAVKSTFPKYNTGHPSRSVHELGIVDMEAILMGLRSRLPRELGYAITVLSMLSMPHPEESVGGLPLSYLAEIYEEILELIEESAFGEGRWEAWIEKMDKSEERKGEVYCGTDLNQLSFLELERLGQDFDFSLDQDEENPPEKENTGGSTDIVLACMNLLKNFSMLPENQPMMASFPALFVSLSRVSDSRLCRLPGPAGHQPYSIIEFARIRRDVVNILTNLGPYIRLSVIPLSATLAVFRVLSTFLVSGWEAISAQDSPYGQSPSVRDVPPTVIHSTYRALEAFCKLAGPDSNREILGRLPAEELVNLFEALLKLFPISGRQREAMATIEDFLGYTECLALAIYSLAFLSPLPVRTRMRSLPSTSGVLVHMISDTAFRAAEFKSNPFSILCRRLCETLGVLNGTVSPAGNAQSMGFSAGAGEGKGWKFASEIVERGWLASLEERILEIGMIRGLDGVVLRELEGSWWGLE